MTPCDIIGISLVTIFAGFSITLVVIIRRGEIRRREAWEKVLKDLEKLNS